MTPVRDNAKSLFNFMKSESPSEKIGRRLSGEEEAILRATKEIVIKFIEMGRCSPASFEEVFTLVFRTIKKTIQDSSIKEKK